MSILNGSAARPNTFFSIQRSCNGHTIIPHNSLCQETIRYTYSKHSSLFDRRCKLMQIEEANNLTHEFHSHTLSKVVIINWTTSWLCLYALNANVCPTDSWTSDHWPHTCIKAQNKQGHRWLIAALLNRFGNTWS